MLRIAPRPVRHQNSSTYCVAPIIGAADQPRPATYDLWAAGKGCCADSGDNFTCGAVGIPGARGGLRLLNRDDDYNFRLAVENAEFTYRLQSVHPLFFEWTIDPISEITAKKDEAFWVYFATNLMSLGPVVKTITFSTFLNQERSLIDSSGFFFAPSSW